MTPESKVKAAIKRVLQARGIWYAMPVSNGMGIHGVPDFLCCWRGQFLAIEAKAPKGRVSKLQQAQLTAIDAAGGDTLVIRDAADLETYLDERTT